MNVVQLTRVCTSPVQNRKVSAVGACRRVCSGGIVWKSRPHSFSTRSTSASQVDSSSCDKEKGSLKFRGSLPIVDISGILPPLAGPGHTSEFAFARDMRVQEAAKKIREACETWGWFYCVGHNVNVPAGNNLMEESRKFFNLGKEEKMRLSLREGGAVLRGYHPREDKSSLCGWDEEMTVGPEHDMAHPHVIEGTPTFGKNQFPDKTVPGLRDASLKYLEQAEALGHTIASLLCVSLGLAPTYMHENLTNGPTVMLKLRNSSSSKSDMDSAREATISDGGVEGKSHYGLMFIHKSEAKGLQCEHPEYGWVDVPPMTADSNVMIVGVGDLLDRMSGGRLRSCRYRNNRSESNATDSASNLSLQLLFDPSWDAKLKTFPLDHLPAPSENPEARWALASCEELDEKFSRRLAREIGEYMLDNPNKSKTFGKSKTLHA
eukprot:Nk52_evm38s266 gene=Nk52_evmTU38s266